MGPPLLSSAEQSLFGASAQGWRVLGASGLAASSTLTSRGFPHFCPAFPYLPAPFSVRGELPPPPERPPLSESLDSMPGAPHPPTSRVPGIQLWLSPVTSCTLTSRPPPARVCRPEALRLGPRRALRPCGFSSAAGTASEPLALAPCPGKGGGAVAQCPGDRPWRARCPPASARQYVAF